MTIVPIALLIYGKVDKELRLTGFGPASPLSLQAVLILALVDFVGYWMHRWLHGRRLWRFHAVHHSSVDLDWLALPLTEYPDAGSGWCASCDIEDMRRLNCR